MALIVTGVSTLIHLYSVAYMGGDAGYRPLLRLPQLLRLLDAAAGPGRQLRPADRRLGVRRLRLLRADQLLVPARDGDEGRDEGLRDQRDRRHRARLRRVPAHPRARHASTTSWSSRQAPRDVHDPTSWTIVAICLLLLVGAFAKSAQIPLHTWLADAMEGPTPVSALIHAATMVTAGVYLIARTHPLFELAPTAADIAAFARARDAAHRGDDRARRHRPEADHRLLDDEPDRLHDRRRLDRRLQRRASST